MPFLENISLQDYAEAATQKFSESNHTLQDIENNFQSRMYGKTTPRLIGAIIGTLCWAAIICFVFFYLQDFLDRTLGLACLGISGALLFFMLIDEIVAVSYYGKIGHYKNNITQLINRVNMGKSNLNANHDGFMKAQANGWQCPLSAGTSIPEEAASIETLIHGMDSLKHGFLNSAKNFFYFVFVIAITGVGCWTMLGTAMDMVNEVVMGFSGSPIPPEPLRNLCLVGAGIVEIATIILAKLWWSHTDCVVTNTTLLVAVLGPILFLVLAIGGTLIAMLVAWVMSVVLAVAVVVIVIGILFGFISGG